MVLVVLLSMLAFQLVDHVRGAQFNQDVVRGSLYLITERLRYDITEQGDLEARFDAQIDIISKEKAHLDDYQLGRLERYDVLVLSDNIGYEAEFITELNDDTLIRITVRNVTELQAQATGQLLLEDWQRSGQTVETFLQNISPHFGYSLSLRPLESFELNKSDLGRMQYGDVLMPIAINADSMDALIKVPGQEQVIRLGPILAFKRYTPMSIAVIALMGFMLLGLGVYWVVNSFEMSLRKLEQATSRLSQGHLNARVGIIGSDPVSRLGQSFNKMADHIQRLISVQREMVRAVSHELRTPVARIRFGLQIIEDTSGDDPFVMKQLTGIDSDIQELDELIDEILTYARLEEGGPLLDFELTNIQNLILQLVDEARPSEHVTVNYGGAVGSQHEAEVEYRYMHRAIQNLIGNACRYAKSQVVVTFSIGADTCRVDVADDGPGIPEKEWNRVFTPFARLDDSRTRSSGGYGLGLSIVRRITYWHGGRAMVSRDELLGGAKFSLVWPKRHQELS
ncbi:MAG: two-component system sensor histidine kinase RstB [Oleispira sp.]|jgi:two-component system sensor histidine kinase RstB